MNAEIAGNKLENIHCLCFVLELQLILIVEKSSEVCHIVEISLGPGESGKSTVLKQMK